MKSSLGLISFPGMVNLIFRHDYYFPLMSFWRPHFLCLMYRLKLMLHPLAAAAACIYLFLYILLVLWPCAGFNAVIITFYGWLQKILGLRLLLKIFAARILTARLPDLVPSPPPPKFQRTPKMGYLKFQFQFRNCLLTFNYLLSEN